VASLDFEWELALPENEFRQLTDEVTMAQHWLVASTFTKHTLIEAGVPAEHIKVIPYGIDVEKYTPRTARPLRSGPLKLLFVGTICQRKGIKYLIEAVDLLPAGSVELTVCGHSVDDLKLLRNCKSLVSVRPFISPQELLDVYRSSDVFVFPSLAEGFGHVLLEAMASGLPIISTTRTAAPDLIREGEEGLIIEPGSVAGIVQAIEYFLQWPEKVDSMGQAARVRAEHFTWGKFRLQLGHAVNEILHQAERASSHV
jgi:glycosyltransferase involved in cell wall biosynthesis